MRGLALFETRMVTQMFTQLVELGLYQTDHVSVQTWLDWTSELAGRTELNPDLYLHVGMLLQCAPRTDNVDMVSFRVAEVLISSRRKKPNFMTLHWTHFKTPPTWFGVCLTEPGSGLFCPSVHWELRRLRSTWLRRCTRLVCRVAEVFDPLQKGEAKLLDSLLWLPGFFVLPSM